MITISCLRTTTALVCTVLAFPATAQPRPGVLALFDSFVGAASGVSVAGHVPERATAGPWRVDGPGAAPFTQAGALLFPAGTASATAAVAAPAGDRTLHTTVYQPAGHTASVVTRVHVRYLDPARSLAVRVEWPASSGNVGVPAPAATVTLDRIEGGQTVWSTVVGTVAHSVYARDLPLVVRTEGDRVEVWTDGLLTGSATSSAFAGAPAVAFSAETPPHPNGGTYARITGVVITTNTPPTAPACPGLSGYAAQSCLRAGHAPLVVYSSDEALSRLYTSVAARGAGTAGRTVEGVYGGGTAAWAPDFALPPRRQIEDDGFTAEHVWPQARGADRSLAAQSDLHTLAPAYGTFRSARGDRAYGDAFRPDQTARWLRGRTVRYASEGPPSAPGTYSRVERDFTRQPDDGDGHVSLAEGGRFDVRHSRRGDVARQAAYFLALYRIEAEDGSEGRAFIETMLETLLRWHRADPVDDTERERDDEAFLAQGNRNPFVSDSSLIQRAFYVTSGDPVTSSVWINEIHHTNDGTDAGEGVELAGPAGTDLYGYRVWAYSGQGSLYATDRGPSVSFRATIGDEGGGLGTVWMPVARLRGGCQGLALTDPAGYLVEFLSTGGCQFNALSGPVFDAAERLGAAAPQHPDSLVWSTGIAGPRPASGGPRRRVQEWTTMPAGYSLQRSGAGRTAADFHWSGPLPASPGRLNDYQAPAAREAGAPLSNRTSGWHAGLPVPDGLIVPLTDDGRDEDALPRPDAAPQATGAETLALGPPRPNPTARLVRFALSAPAGATLSAVVVDALGRVVLRAPLSAGDVSLDVSGLAVGAYAVRVTALFPGGRSQTTTRRVVVAR